MEEIRHWTSVCHWAQWAILADSRSAQLCNEQRRISYFAGDQPQGIAGFLSFCERRCRTPEERAANLGQRLLRLSVDTNVIVLVHSQAEYELVVAARKQGRFAPATYLMASQHIRLTDALPSTYLYRQLVPLRNTADSGALIDGCIRFHPRPHSLGSKPEIGDGAPASH